MIHKVFAKVRSYSFIMLGGQSLKSLGSIHELKE